MIRLTRNGLEQPADLTELRSQLTAQGAIRLPGLLSPDLISAVTGRIEGGIWRENIHAGINRELLLDDDVTLELLHFLFNRHEFLETISQLVGEEPLGCFRGRVFRMMPGAEFEVDWHDDLTEDNRRAVGLSMNLGTMAYGGGEFEMRAADSGKQLFRSANVGCTDATLFRISEDLQHRVAPIRGDVPRTTFAGWFLWRRNTGQSWANLRIAGGH
jgi:hypothetical protein